MLSAQGEEMLEAVLLLVLAASGWKKDQPPGPGVGLRGGNLRLLGFLRLAAVLSWHSKADRNWQVKLDLQLLCIAKTGKAARTYQWIWPIGFGKVSPCDCRENRALPLEAGWLLPVAVPGGIKLISLLSVSFFFFFLTHNRKKNIKNKTFFH